MLLSGHGYTQVHSELQSPMTGQVTPDDLWNMNLNYQGIEKLYVYLTGKLNDSEGNLLMNIKTPVFELQPGLNIVSTKKLGVLRYDFRDAKLNAALKEQAILPEGSYHFCISIITVNDQAEIGQNCMDFQAVSGAEQPSAAGKGTENKKPGIFKISGNSELTGSYSNDKHVNQLMPASYLLWSLNPDFSLYNLAFDADMLLTTMQSPERQSMNYFRVGFDPQKFTEGLKAKAIDAITKKEEAILEKGRSYLETAGDLSKIESILSNPAVAEDLLKLEQLKSVEAQLRDTSLINDTIKQDSLKNVLRSLDDFKRKRKSYENLLEKKQKLEDAQSKLQVPDSLLNYQKYDLSLLNDPDVLKDKLGELGIMRKADKLFYAVRNLGVGTTFPSYTPLTLGNMPVSGLSVQLEPAKVYMAFTYGNLKREAISYDLTSSSLKKNMIAGGLGYGNKDGNHLHFHVLSFNDIQGTAADDTLLMYYKPPQSNKVIAADFRVNLFKNKLIVGGELSGSQTVRKDTWGIQEQLEFTGTDETAGNEKDWLTNIVMQKPVNLYTAVDYAYRVDVSGMLFKDKTEISASLQRTGPRYESAGLPFLMKGILGIEGRVRQSLIRDQVMMGVIVKTFRDNLNHTESATSHMMRLGFDLSLRFRKMPFLKASLIPLTMQTDTLRYSMTLMTFTGGHSYKTGPLRNNTMISYIRQDGKFLNLPGKFTADMITLNHVMQLTSASSLNMGFCYAGMKNGDSARQSITMNTGGSVTVFKKWSHSAGLSYLFGTDQKKPGYFYQTSLAFARKFTFAVRVEQTAYDGVHYYTEPENQIYQTNIFTARASLIARW